MLQSTSCGVFHQVVLKNRKHNNLHLSQFMGFVDHEGVETVEESFFVVEQLVNEFVLANKGLPLSDRLLLCGP